MNKIKIKWLQPNNCEILREMIFKFNKVMNVEGKMKLSVEDLKRDAFSTPPFYHCLLAEWNEEIIGYCIFNFVYDTNIGKRIYIEEVFVDEKVQGQSIGTSLVMSVAQYAKVNGFSGVFLVSKSSTNAFYNKLGFINETEEEGYSVYTVERDTFEKLLLDHSFIDIN